MKAVAGLYALLFACCAGAAPAPHVVAGVDFDNMTYFAGTDRQVRLRDGEDKGSADREIDTTIGGLWSGKAGGRVMVLVLLHYELPATGYDEVVDAFVVDRGRARELGRIGEFDYFEDVGGPGVWFYSRFSSGKLYVDAFRGGCNKHADWEISTYAFRRGTFERIRERRHHRAGQPYFTSDC